MDAKKKARAGARENEALRLRTYLETFKRHHVQARHLRSAKNLDLVMTAWVLPVLGDRPINEISKKEILDLLSTISSPSAANRTFDWLRTMMNFARRRSDIERSPLDNLLKPHIIPPRERVLTDRELQRLWEASHDLQFPDGQFVRTLILTGLRNRAAHGARWEEFDFDRNVWVIPKERTKNKKPFLVPLSSTMREMLLTEWPSEPRRGLLFVSSNGKQPSTGHLKKRLDVAIAARMRIAAQLADESFETMAHFNFHDLRRTLATGLQRLDVPAEHTEAVLNHRIGTASNLDVGLVGIYQLWKYEPEKRRALNKWDGFIARLMSRPDAWPGGKALP